MFERVRYRVTPSYVARGGVIRIKAWILDIPPSSAVAEWLPDVASEYRAHRFDLLGSGWVQVRYGMECRGLEGVKYPPKPAPPFDVRGKWLLGRVNSLNVPTAQYLWSLIEGPYEPIDWQIDFKSGYRWSERLPSTKIRIGSEPGADIKVPWELARMQHLAILARAFACAQLGQDGLENASQYTREFRNQVLDFIATNPPGFGVNWVCPMDVGIRIANILIAYDLFRSWGASFDHEFERELGHAVWEHARYVFEHLEDYSKANHYLANIVGLLFAAAHLTDGDSWLHFALSELDREVIGQFLPDGGNFEGSTSYHRFSSEMAVYGTAVALRIGHCDLGESYVSRLEKMGEFVAYVMKPDFRMPQVGDNDSGRFFKVDPALRRLSENDAQRQYGHLRGGGITGRNGTYWDEDILDHRHLIGAVLGIVRRSDLRGYVDRVYFDEILTRAISRGKTLQSVTRPEAQLVRVGTEDDLRQWARRLQQEYDCQEVAFRLPEGKLSLFGYPDFGFYVYRSDRVYVGIRCGYDASRTSGAHAHNDQLSVELWLDGKNIGCDPGSYLYTPFPKRRNEYRSVQAHYAPRTVDGREPARIDISLFSLGEGGEGSCLCFVECGFLGMHKGFGFPVYRLVTFGDGTIRIADFGPKGMLVRPVPPTAPPCSWGYGKRSP